MDGNKEKVGQEQIHTLLFEEKLSWQSLIYDLINSEQLDPWNIDLTLLANKYLEKVRQLEEANFFISSKVLLAASLLLRIKSEVVLNEDIPTLDDILFGVKEETSSIQERIEFDEDVPALVPRTPLPRFRRVTLDELMSALGKALTTETRRIRKHVLFYQQEKEVALAIPKRTINLQVHIKQLYAHLQEVFSSRDKRLAFSELIPLQNRDAQIAAFVSLLHLDTQQKVWLEQEGHFDEIWIWLKELYESKYGEQRTKLQKEVEEFMLGAEKEQDKSDSIAGESLADDVPSRFAERSIERDEED